MSQDQLIILLLKIVVVADVAAILAFIGIYTALAPWWKNILGRTIVIKDILLFLVFVPTVLSFFFRFNRLTSHISAWVDIVLFAAIAVVMTWRCFVWVRMHRERIREGGEDA